MIYNTVPKQPDDDEERWSTFLAAYQSGKWDSTESSSQQCSSQARRVQLDENNFVDSQEFFKKFNYLAAPSVPKDKLQIRNSTLLQYGLSDQQARPCVNRYVKHARSVFKCDYASVSVACTQSSSTVFLAKEGACTDMATTAINTICDHALLLGERDVFLIKDLEQDWRFEHFNFRCGHGQTMRFYASAPILLPSLQESGSEGQGVQVGRLAIMREQPWMEFGEAEADLLMDIAIMTQEALENEYLSNQAKQIDRMQQETTHLSWQFNLLAPQEMAAKKVEDSKSTFPLHSSRMQLMTDVVKDVMEASTVTAIDVSDLKLQQYQVHSSASSPTARFKSGSYLSPPSSKRLMARKLSQDSDAAFSSESRFADSDTDTVATSLSGTTFNDDSKFRWDNQRPEPIRMPTYYKETTARIIAQSGDRHACPSTQSSVQRGNICTFFSTVRSNKYSPRSFVFDNQSNKKNLNDVDKEEVKDMENDSNNPLASLMTAATQSYCTICIFANDEIQPLILFLVTFDRKKVLTESEFLFLDAIKLITCAECLGQQAKAGNFAQVNFIRSVQNDLRTPLQGIRDITTLLNKSLNSGLTNENVDLTEDGVLTSLLESIHLSSVSLSNILDDVLDFGTMTIPQGSRATTMQIQEVNLVREIEETCFERMEDIAMRERKNHEVTVYRGYVSLPTLIIRVAPELPINFRTDRAKFTKILAKFITNALRYTNEHNSVELIVSPRRTQTECHLAGDHQWIDFVIQDSGIGMSQEFLDNSLLKPFSKESSRSQGVGLGVTIAANLISHMGGQLSIQSKLGTGTRVKISLPLGYASMVSIPLFPVLPDPLQVRKASFFGFSLQGHMKIVELIRERLIYNGIEIVEPHQAADLVILTETSAVNKAEESDLIALSAKPATTAPKPVGLKGRILVVTRNPSRCKNNIAFDGIPVSLFGPPFGPSSLDAMEAFLRE